MLLAQEPNEESIHDSAWQYGHALWPGLCLAGLSRLTTWPLGVPPYRRSNRGGIRRLAHGCCRELVTAESAGRIVIAPPNRAVANPAIVLPPPFDYRATDRAAIHASRGPGRLAF